MEPWSPLVSRAKALAVPCSPAALEGLDRLLNEAMTHPRRQIVVPPSLDGLFHLAAEADFLPHRLARAHGYDLHHFQLLDGDERPALPTGSAYGDAVLELDAVTLLSGYDSAERFTQPGCVVWCECLAA